MKESKLLFLCIVFTEEGMIMIVFEFVCCIEI